MTHTTMEQVKLKTILLSHVLEAMNVICSSKAQMNDERRKYLSSKKMTWEITERGLFQYADRVITSIFFTGRDKSITYMFENENYKEFYSRNKYSVSKEREAVETLLVKWHEDLSKNKKKDISKIIFQFERTKSVKAAYKILKALPISFIDSETFSSKIKISPILPSKEEEARMEQNLRVKSLVSKIKELESSLESKKNELKRAITERKESKNA